jgi:hypothetical protein
MFSTVFNKELTHAFIECTCLNENANLKKIENELNDSKSWQRNLHVVAYFIAIVLEKKKKEGKNVEQAITDLYSLPDNMFLKVQELDSSFIDFMLRHVNPEIDNLESAIVQLHERWIDHDYSRNIRL